MRRGREEEGFDLFKVVLLGALLTGLFVVSSAVLTSFPQHIALTNDTRFDSGVSFQDNGKVTVRGNQVSYGAGDVIPLQGRDFVRITGNQVQLGDSKLQEGIRVISASMSQIIIFEQRVGQFSMDNKAARVIIDGNYVDLIPLSDSAINVKTATDNYNIIFAQGTTYLTYKNTMLRLNKNGNSIVISAVGLKNYQTIAIRTV